MAKVANPAKVFNFRIEMDGIDQWEVQEVNIPDAEVEVTEHGDANSTVGTAGRIKFGDMVIKNLVPLPLGDDVAWDWLMDVQNPETGSGGLPDEYKRVIIVKQLLPDNKTTAQSWICIGTFPKKISNTPFSRTSGENRIKELTLWVDKVRRG